MAWGRIESVPPSIVRSAHDGSSDADDPTVETPQSVPLSDLSAFRRDLLLVIASFEGTDAVPAGVAIAEDLRAASAGSVSQGRFYQNLRKLVALGAVETPDVKLFLYDDQESKRANVQQILAERPGKTLVLCDNLDRGRDLTEDLDAPFVSGETTDRMDVFQDLENRIVIGSRVADEGLSLADLDVVVEYDFHGGSRRQEAQRYGRVMHGESTGEHLILMTDAEYEKYSKRLLSLEEQGVTVVPERRE